MRKPKIEEEATRTPKPVKTYALGTVPMVHTQGQVEKSGVISIVAQTPGIVSAIRIKEGQSVAAKNQLFTLSSNYQGGNSTTVARQIAQTQYANVVKTYAISKELIQKQKEVADKSRDNANELRQITEHSLDETRDLLSLNDTILNTINNNLNAATTDAAIFAAQQQKSQFQSATNQLRAALRQAEYQADEKKPPQEIANLQRDIAVKQLELQEKSLDLSREISGLQVRLAQITEATMYPAAPFAGRIERIHVRVGQTVNPGTPLATLAGTEGDIRLVAKVPKDIAARISTTEYSTVRLPDRTIRLTPTFIAGEATDGTLVSVSYDLTADDASALTDTQSIPIELPVGSAASTSASFFIPLDGVFQSQETSSVYVLDNGTARARTVTLGPVVGNMVEIIDGIAPTDEVILDRTVLDGEQVVRTEETNEPKKKQELGMK